MLHKTVADIEEMDVEEFVGWQIWLKMKNERSKT
jgi:hypothetical protein